MIMDKPNPPLPEPSRPVDLLEEARWSDAFFNYVPAEQGYLDADYDPENPGWLAIATEFVEANPESPFAPRWYAWEFFRRL